VSDFRGLYNVRDYKPEDKHFIMATFLKGLYYGESYFSLMEKQTFMNNYKPVAEALINKRTIKVACLPDDPDVILGYAITSNDYQSLDWCFVKSAWRRKGIAKSLVPAHPANITHLTNLGKSLMPKLKGAVFDPFKL
jgi:hypothetical protein